MKPHRLLIIDAKALNRAADDVLKRRGVYFESPLTRYHRLKRQAKEKAAK
jgi:hypothetical protein